MVKLSKHNNITAVRLGVKTQTQFHAAGPCRYVCRVRIECVTCHVECVTVSSCNAMYAGLHPGLVTLSWWWSLRVSVTPRAMPVGT